MARDGKKSFFELNQSTSQEAPVEENNANEAKKTEIVEASPNKIAKDDSEKQSLIAPAIIDEPLGKNENDLNALDYEADKDDNIEESEMKLIVKRVEIENKVSEKSTKANKHSEIDGKGSRKDSDSKKTERRRRSRSRDKRRSRSKDKDRRPTSRGHSDRRAYRRGRDSPQRDNRRRDAHRFKRNRSRSPSHDRSRKPRHRDSRYCRHIHNLIDLCRYLKLKISFS